MILVAGLFGHRHPGDPLWLEWSHAASAWVGSHWTALAVVIPIAGVIVAAVVNHCLALARESRARAVGRKDLRARVHADLAARLLTHCSSIQSAIAAANADPGTWSSGNASLRRRAENSDVVDALGGTYVSFMAAIEKERRTIDALGRTYDGAATERNGSAERIADGAWDIIETYVPFIGEFGEASQAGRLRRFASAGRKRV